MGLLGVAQTPAMAQERYRDRDYREYNQDRDRDREWRNAYERDRRYARTWEPGRYDYVYRGYDDRYYCRRSDGTTGLIVGGITGGVLGNIIAPGDSRTLGTILGAAGGAIVGRSIDRNNIVCR